MYNNIGWQFENSQHAASTLGYDADDDGYYAWIEATESEEQDIETFTFKMED